MSRFGRGGECTSSQSCLKVEIAALCMYVCIRFLVERGKTEQNGGVSGSEGVK